MIDVEDSSARSRDAGRAPDPDRARQFDVLEHHRFGPAGRMDANRFGHASFVEGDRRASGMNRSPRRGRRRPVSRTAPALRCSRTGGRARSRRCRRIPPAARRPARRAGFPFRADLRPNMCAPRPTQAKYSAPRGRPRSAVMLPSMRSRSSRALSPSRLQNITDSPGSTARRSRPGCLRVDAHHVAHQVVAGIGSGHRQRRVQEGRRAPQVARRDVADVLLEHVQRRAGRRA